jgi:hypothetical protein
VAPGQLGGCATAPGRLTISTSCELEIAAADARSRRLVIEALDPLELGRTIDADGRRIVTRGELAPGKASEIFVGKAGETLRLRCLSGFTCRVNLQ